MTVPDQNIKNPFSVQTPEDMKAQDVTDLFVDVFSDFYHVPNQGHTFLNGPRGSGKSMMFRFMLPDCQRLKSGKSLNEIDYFSIYVPIKKTTINIIDLERLERHGQSVLNEHLLTMFIATICFETLSRYFACNEAYIQNSLNPLTQIYNNHFASILRLSGYSGSIPSIEKEDSVNSIFSKMYTICSQIYLESNDYVKRLALTKKTRQYTGAICGYLDFLFPILSKLKELPLFPDKPLFLLIDDADNLNETQKKVLNTWVSYRTSAKISLKISTQLNYNMFRTISGFTIDSPHDYSEVNIASVYTSDKNKYMARLREIVNKRLANANIPFNAEEFFPVNDKQAKRIREIYEKIRSEHSVRGRGTRPTDDAYRYATSEYIKELIQGRSVSTYCYAGFEELVHISSGIIRLFLEPAALMYSEMMRSGSHVKGKIGHIDPMIQNRVIKNYADKFMFQEFDKLKEDEYKHDSAPQGYSLSKTEKLKNLIHGMGGLFYKILISDLSERRVFSIALNDEPDKELLEILNLGVQYGYLHESSISNKTRTGRSKLYILSRRLAPFFTLDPSSFAGYKHMNSRTLKLALKNPDHFRKEVLKEKPPQGSLFNEEDLQ